MRLNGKFLNMWLTSGGYVFIEEVYSLYKPTLDQLVHWSYYDKKEWRAERERFIQAAKQYEMGDTMYVVTFDSMIPDEHHEQLVMKYHNKLTGKVRFSDDKK